MWVRPKEQKVVGGRLATARRLVGYTQQDLAKKLGKPQSFVSAYEAGQRRIDVLEFIRIVQAIGTDPGKLFKTIVRGHVGPKRKA